MKTKKRYAIFWIKSGRGTDDMDCFEIPNDISKDDLNYHLEDWCSKFGCWNMSESFVEYGWCNIKRPPREGLVHTMYDKACKSKNKANRNWKKWAAMLHPIKLKV